MIANGLSLSAMKMKINWDGLGILTSLICAIHCMLLPILLPTLPLLGINKSHNSIFEWSMISIAFLVGIYALKHGYQTHHHRKLPFVVFSIGFILLVSKQFFTNPTLEYVLLGLAVLLIVWAHYTNYKLCTKSKCRSEHHSH